MWKEPVPKRVLAFTVLGSKHQWALCPMSCTIEKVHLALKNFLLEMCVLNENNASSFFIWKTYFPFVILIFNQYQVPYSLHMIIVHGRKDRNFSFDYSFVLRFVRSISFSTISQQCRYWPTIVSFVNLA